MGISGVIMGMCRMLPIIIFCHRSLHHQPITNYRNMDSDILSALEIVKVESRMINQPPVVGQ